VLLKKLRMFNMIAKFCKIGELIEIKRHNDLTARILRDLLDDDDFDNYEEELLQGMEFDEAMNEMMKRLFSPDEQTISTQLRNFKRNYKMKFSTQPEYYIREDLEHENQFGRDY